MPTNWTDVALLASLYLMEDGTGQYLMEDGTSFYTLEDQGTEVASWTKVSTI